MTKMLFLLHTSPVLTPMFSELCARHMPDVTLMHMVDESLIKNTIRSGRLEDVTRRRLITMVDSAFQGGADAVLFTCSSMGPAVDTAKTLFNKPVLRVDEPMADAAAAIGGKIGVVATLRTTLGPTLDLVCRKAPNAEVRDYLCEGAFEAVMAGDAATHDRLVGETLTRMNDRDVIVLAQASMARVLKTLPEGAVKAPVLSSPELGVKRMAEILSQTNAGSTAK